MSCCGYWPVCKLFSVMYTDAMVYLYAWERNSKRTSTFEEEKKSHRIHMFDGGHNFM